MKLDNLVHPGGFGHHRHGTYSRHRGESTVGFATIAASILLPLLQLIFLFFSLLFFYFFFIFFIFLFFFIFFKKF